MKNLKGIFSIGMIILFAICTVEAINIYGIKARTLSLGNIDGCSFIELHGTNSMLPTIHEGDWICYIDYSKYKEKNKLNVGDIITFQYKQYEGGYIRQINDQYLPEGRITHRIVKVYYKSYNITSIDFIITKGDNNKKEDLPIFYPNEEVLNIVKVIVIK